MKIRLIFSILMIMTIGVQAQEFGTNDLRISDMGPNGATNFFALDPAVAYSITDSKYLVVWSGDDDTGSLVDNEFEIYGQFIDALGNEVGTNDFRISFNNTDGNADFRTDTPDVTWNSITNQFFVVWEGETTVNGEVEIYGQIVNSDGTLSGGNFRISDTGPEGDTNFDANGPEVAFNATNNEYLVVWESDETINNNIEIYGQRISATGVELGSNDFQISTQLPANDDNFDARDPDVAWNSSSNEYLVVWQGETATNEEKEIFAQRLNNNTTLLGSNFKISDMGADGDTGFVALYPKLSYNADDDKYLVVWQGSDLVSNQYEVYGQFISSTGTEIGTNDFRITSITDVNSNYDINRPEIVWNDTNNEFLIVYRGETTVDSEFEILGQLVDASGNLISESFVLSDMGPNGDTNFGAFDGVVATDSISNYIIAWQGDDDVAPLVGNENEIFIQMYKNETLSIPDVRLNTEIKIYPNPANTYLYFNGHIENQTINIYNVLGQEELRTKVSNDKSIDVRKLKSGLYILKTEKQIVKFIKSN
ncbi:MAG: T9SS type A sorting domain-containing protein [Flavobacteriaceae bacterium]|nr:T9SS type A sorting domain-containing protein [Flavobacteriaceae bacterium]